MSAGMSSSFGACPEALRASLASGGASLPIRFDASREIAGKEKRLTGSILPENTLNTENADRIIITIPTIKRTNPDAFSVIHLYYTNFLFFRSTLKNDTEVSSPWPQKSLVLAGSFRILSMLFKSLSFSEYEKSYLPILPSENTRSPEKHKLSSLEYKLMLPGVCPGVSRTARED